MTRWSATAYDDVHATRFCVLGSLEAWRGRNLLRFPAARQRTVLAVLIANAGVSVSTETLVAELWPEGAPISARKTLQGYVWRIRRSLDCERITTTDNGYQFCLCDAYVDAFEFSTLVGTARREVTDRPERAVPILDRALGLWRGPAYASVSASPLVRADAARLDEARLSAQELLISARLQLGDYHEATPELTGLATLHPHRESIHRLLMAALYHAGRRLDALEVYSRLQQVLADEYGLDPQHETVALHQEILRGTAPVEFTASLTSDRYRL